MDLKGSSFVLIAFDTSSDLGYFMGRQGNVQLWHIFSHTATNLCVLANFGLEIIEAGLKLDHEKLIPNMIMSYRFMYYPSYFLTAARPHLHVLYVQKCPSTF